MVVPVLTGSAVQSRCSAAGPGPPHTAASVPVPVPVRSHAPIAVPVPAQGSTTADRIVTAAIFLLRQGAVLLYGYVAALLYGNVTALLYGYVAALRCFTATCRMGGVGVAQRDVTYFPRLFRRPWPHR